MWFGEKILKFGNKSVTGRHLDIKARRRGWHRRLGMAGRLAVVVAGLGVLGWMGIRTAVDAFLLKNDAFALRRFELRTDGRLTREQALRWSGVKQGDNVLALDLAQIKRNLEMVSMVRAAAVERIIPDQLRVRLWERRPVFKAYILSPGEQGGRMAIRPYMIDAFGFVLSPKSSGSGALERESFWQQLPELTGINRLQLIPGETAQSRQVNSAIQTLIAFNGSRLAERVKIRSIDVSKRRVLVVRTSDQQEVTLGREALATQFRRWKIMLDRAKQENMRLVSLDLSVKNNHPFRWVQRSTRGSPPAETQPQLAGRTET